MDPKDNKQQAKIKQLSQKLAGHMVKLVKNNIPKLSSDNKQQNSPASLQPKSNLNQERKPKIGRPPKALAKASLSEKNIAYSQTSPS